MIDTLFDSGIHRGRRQFTPFCSLLNENVRSAPAHSQGVFYPHYPEATPSLSRPGPTADLAPSSISRPHCPWQIRRGKNGCGPAHAVAWTCARPRRRLLPAIPPRPCRGLAEISTHEAPRKEARCQYWRPG